METSVRWQSSVNRQRRTETVAASQAAFTPLIKSIGVDELHRLRQDDENSLILVDVRERSDTDQTIPGCINIPRKLTDFFGSITAQNRCTIDALRLYSHLVEEKLTAV